MDMTMESCRKFVEVLASDAPAPGGGGLQKSAAAKKRKRRNIKEEALCYY